MYPSPRVRDSVTPPTRGYKPRVPIGTVPTTRFRVVNWLLLISAMLINGYAISANAADKVTICHKSKNTLSISGNALQAHLNHGDTEGACENSDTDGALSIEPTSHDFGSVNLDKSSADKPFTIVNESDNSLTLGFIDELASVTTTIDESGNVTTAYSKEFRITDDNCSNAIMAEKYATCEFAMVFEPKEIVGTRTLNLFVPHYTDESGNPNSLILPLTGEGVLVPIPNIESSIMLHDFGDVEIGKSSDEQILRISNSGEADLVIGQLSLSNTGDFNIILDLCSGITVSPTQNCSVRMQFTPQSEGAKTATLSIPSDDPDTPTLDVSFTGNGVIPPMPNISIKAMSIDFGEIQLGTTSGYQTISIYNIGDAPLQLGQLSSLAGTDFERITDVYAYISDQCSNKTISPAKRCLVNVRFNPQSTGAKTGTLSIPSDDPDMPTVDVALNGIAVGWCQGDYEQSFNAWPDAPNFGTEVVGNSIFVSQSINSSARGCDALQIADIVPTGANANEFEIIDLQCYHSTWEDWSYSSCWFKTVFTPTAAGTKNAELTVTYTDSTTAEPVPLQAVAVDSGQPQLEVSPSSHDFGTVMVGTSSYQNFAIKNTGNVNVGLDNIDLTGDSNDFTGYKWSRCAYLGVLYPNESCNLYMSFMPSSEGAKQANLSVSSNDVPTVNVALTGMANIPVDCSEENITIESNGEDNKWATQASDGSYTGDSAAWTRLQNPDPTIAAPNRPTALDVVRINSGHFIYGIPFAQVKTLCIEQGGQLKSMDRRGTPLEIQATDYIQNRGDIHGLLGDDEMTGATSCTNQNAIGSAECANAGASVILKVGSKFEKRGKLGDWWWYGSGGPILNEGEIIAGSGGKGSQYGAPGGDALIIGRNTTNKGIIQAGNGGDMTGSAPGKGGQGGLTQIWGKLGGSGHLSNTNGAYALAGDGGNCNPGGGNNQIGGDGGNLWLVSLPNVHLSGGIHESGEGGNIGCSTNGQDGWVRIEPVQIDLSGANTVIKGGNIEIFCGDDCNLDLSGITETAITATGDITIAVGEKGSINMSGSTNLFKAGGQVNIFANSVKLDPGVELADIIEATDIVVAEGRIWRDVSITGPGTLVGEPGETLTVKLTLTNNSAEADTYDISVTDSAGWTLTQLPTTTDPVGELTTIELELNVTLPATPSAKNMITVSATSQADTSVVATANVQVSVTDAPQGNATVNEGIVNLPGVETNVDGGDVSIIAAADDGKIDLRNLGGNTAITATGDVTLAIGANGTIDLTGNTSQIIKAGGKVIIYGRRDQIKMDAGVDLITLFGVMPEFRAVKSAYDVSWTAPSNMSKPAGSIVPLRFTLTNAGLESDTYTISVTDSLNLPLTLPPSLQRLKGLDSAELLLNVALMTTAGQTEKVTITATSRTNSNVIDTATVSINVGAASATTGGTTGGGSGTGTSACPSTGIINRLCSNRGNVITDSTVESGAGVSGGSIDGTINNNGMISQVTVEVGAILIGGRISGSILNKGTIKGPTTFVGITLEGGIIEDVITNDSKVGGIIKNVRLAKNARIVNGAVEGEIIGDPSGPGILENVIVRSGTKLSNVILINVQLGSGISFGAGVRFADPEQLPDMELMALLPDLPTAILVDGITIDSRQVDFTADVVEPSDGILAFINKLPLFTDNGWALTQNGKWGYFEVTIDNVRYAEIPSSMVKTTEPPDMMVLDAQSLNFVISSGLGVLTHPALQAPDALRVALSELFSITEFTVQTNGNIYVPVAEGEWYSARSDWSSIRLDSEPENVGLSVDISPHVSGASSASLVFDNDGEYYRQNLFPSLANPEALAEVAENISIEPYGLVNFTLNGKAYRGVVDYLVSQGTETTVETLRVESIADVNGDGIDDIVLVYPTAERQIVVVVE